MAAYLFANGANGTQETVITGSTTNTNSAGVINLQIDLGTATVYNADGSTRSINKAEVVEGLVVLTNYIIRGSWYV